MDAHIKVLIDENTTESDVIIYTDGSVIQNKWCVAFLAQIGGTGLTLVFSAV